MRFSQLIAVLQDGEAGLLEHQLSSDPELRGAASLERAGADQLSFLEKGNALIQSLETSEVGAVLIPNQDDLKALAEQRGLAWAVMRDPRLAFAEALERLHPRPRIDAAIHPSELIGSGSLQRCSTTELRIAAELMLQQTCLSLLKDGD